MRKNLPDCFGFSQSTPGDHPQITTEKSLKFGVQEEVCETLQPGEIIMPTEAKEPQFMNSTNQVGIDIEAYFRNQFLSKLAEQNISLPEFEKINRQTSISAVPKECRKAFAIAKGMTVEEKICKHSKNDKNIIEQFENHYTNEYYKSFKNPTKKEFLVVTHHRKVPAVVHMNRINYTDGIITAERNRNRNSDIKMYGDNLLHSSAILQNQFLSLSKEKNIDKSQFTLRQVRQYGIDNQETNATLKLIAPPNRDLLLALDEFVQRSNSHEKTNYIDVDSISSGPEKEPINKEKAIYQYKEESNEYSVTYQFGEGSSKYSAIYRLKKDDNNQCFANYRFEKGSNGYLSMLGTPNAYGTLYLLKEYPDTFGDREITSIEAENSIDYASPDYASSDVIFHIDAILQGS